MAVKYRRARDPKNNGFLSPHSKREQAEQRNAEWQSLPLIEQLADLDDRGERALKQRARIAARMAAGEV